MITKTETEASSDQHHPKESALKDPMRIGVWIEFPNKNTTEGFQTIKIALKKNLQVLALVKIIRENLKLPQHSSFQIYFNQRLLKMSTTLGSLQKEGDKSSWLKLKCTETESFGENVYSKYFNCFK